jgi:hypothetical protein
MQQLCDGYWRDEDAVGLGLANPSSLAGLLAVPAEIKIL